MRGLLPLLLCAAGCAQLDPAEVPAEEPFLVLVKSCRLPAHLPPPISLAHHAWFDLKQGSEQAWTRVEVNSGKAVTRQNVLRIFPIDGEEARSLERWDRTVYLHEAIRGPEAERIAAEVLRQARGYPDAAVYNGWPGPNSNTFIDRIGRKVDGLRFELHHDCVGKDMDGLLRLGMTTTGTGVELETLLCGFQLGLVEGIELHVLQLTFGVDLWPPALKLPFLPRLGFQ